MRIIRYVFTFFLILIGFISSSERFIYHIAYFDQSFYSISFSYDTYGAADSTNLLAKEVLKEDLNTYKFDVFYVDREYISDIDEKITVYGTNGALQYLRTQGILPETYQSLFIGKVEICFLPLEKLESINETDVFYYIGTIQDAVNFKNIHEESENYINYYTVDELKSKSGSDDGLYATLCLIWGGVYSLILLSTLFLVTLKKREISVYIVLGKNPLKMFFVSAVSDIIVYFCIFVLLYGKLNLVHLSKYISRYILFSFAILLVVNTFIYVLNFRLNIAKEIRKKNRDNKIINITYIVKSVSLILLCIILSSNVVLLKEEAEYFGQERIFSQLSDYEYYKFNSWETDESLSENHEKNQDTWCAFAQRFYKSSICIVDQTEQIEYNSILMNQNAVKLIAPYINSTLAEQLLAAQDRKLYVFLPNDFPSNKVDELMQLVSLLYLPGVDSPKEQLIVSSYEKNDRIFAINRDRYLNRSSYVQNPVIFIDNIERQVGTWYMNPVYSFRDTLYKVSHEELQSFLKEMQLENNVVTATSAQDIYEYNCQSMQRSTKLLVVISSLLILLEITITLFLVRLEYSIHGMEIAIKKTLGYSIASRKKSLLITPIIIIFCCTLSALIIEKQTNWGNTLWTVGIGCSIAIVEISITMLQSLRFDKIQIQTILKGGKQ